MKRIRPFAFLIPIAMSLWIGVPLHAQTAAEWHQDIDTLTDLIEQYHPSPWANISREAFIGKARSIKANIGNWDRERTILELVKLVASLRDGHTQLFFANQAGFNLWFPIRFENFHDGIFITATDMKHSGLLGSKVLRFGERTAASAFGLVGAIIASDSDYGIARLVTNYLSNAVVLRTLEIIESEKHLFLEVVLPDGVKKTVSVESAEWVMGFYWAWNRDAVPTNGEIKTIFDEESDALPLYLSKIIPSSAWAPYWFEYIPKDRMLYFQFNRMINWSEEPFRDFTTRLFRKYDEHVDGIDKFVIDLRLNDGGNGYLLPPMVREFARRDASSQTNRLYIITGSHTFSAASNLIAQLLENTRVTTVGDIAAGPLNWYSDTVTFNLPNSNLFASISTMFWQKGQALDSRGYYPPDYYVPATFEDYISCSDPALQAIRRGEAVSLKQILFNEGADKFRSELLRREKLHGDLKGWFPYISFDLLFFANNTLFPTGKDNEALEILKLNTRIYPEDIAAWNSLAATHTARGEPKEALRCYEKLLAIEPHHAQARLGRDNARAAIADQQD
jgi:tetratricopeptide (TPR) repeat protein